MPRPTTKLAQPKTVEKPKAVVKRKRRQAPGNSLEARENKLIGLSIDLAAKQLREGTASAQVITHFLKLGSSMVELEKEKLRKENELLRAKSDALASAKNVEKLYTDALEAMRAYSGQPVVPEDGRDED